MNEKTDEIRKELSVWLEEKTRQFVEDIDGLVRIPSVAKPPVAIQTGEEAPFGEACREVLEKMLSYAVRDGIPCMNHEGYCASLTVGEGGHEIGIWNHLDVVPAGGGWRYEPFALHQEGDFIIGRGVQDNKGPAIAVYYALLFCEQKKLLRNIRVRQILGCQEESGMEDVKYYIAHYAAPEFSFVADCSFPVCCGEKGICRVTLQAKERTKQFTILEGGVACNSVPGSALAEIIIDGQKERKEAFGVSGHGAFPEGTKNAIGALAEQLQDYPLGDREKNVVTFLQCAGADGYGRGLGIECEDTCSGKLTCNAGILRMEEGRPSLELDIRYPVTAQIQGILEKIQQKAREYGFEIIRSHDDPPHYMEKEQPFVTLLMEAWRKEKGGTEEAYVMGGGTYARHIPRAVGFGTGMEKDLSGLNLPEGHGNCHCADEVESICNLKKAILIYVRALQNIDNWYAEQNKEIPD
ncbi:MAG: M20/M25/M40 family metallo-hydrolase [Eubacteriales bacterium]|nr:M20/M25/M40 family metallo-hydrolase [Eubacteriales bacterium]